MGVEVLSWPGAPTDNVAAPFAIASAWSGSTDSV